MVQLRSGLVSITGNFRDNNEDRGYADPESRFFLVADGMGGQSAGEKASELATELVAQKLGETLDFEQEKLEDVVKAVDRAVEYANSEIMALGEVDPNYHNMGTTLVFLLRVGDRLYVGGVGDSRVYQLRGEEFKQLTTDHSLTQALLDAGTITEEDATNHRYRNVLYRYLGTKEGGTGTSPQEFEPREGDRYVLCTDGVTDGIGEETLTEVLQEHEDPQEAAQAVVDAALDGGSRDNITCLVVDVEAVG